MGRKSITGGVMPAGTNRVRFDFSIDGKRFRPTLPWTPNETNLRQARSYLTRIKAQIELVHSASQTSFRGTAACRDFRPPSNRVHAVKCSTNFSVTRNLALHAAIWRR
jgi:hypothetical protein